MKRLTASFFIFILVGLLSGCLRIQSHSSLLTPPAIPSEQANLSEEINNHIPDQSEILVPLNQENSEPFILEDLDGDGKNEVIFFYKIKGNSNDPKGIILTKKEKWEKLAEIDGSGNYLFDLQFADLNGDGKKEIIAGFGYSDSSSQHGLLVYDIFSNKKPKLLFNELYTKFIIDTFKPNDINSLVTFHLEPTQYNIVSLYHFDKNHLQLIAEANFDANINGYENIISGLITPTKTGVVANVGSGAHSGGTFITQIENQEITPILIANDELSLTAYPVYSDDQNGDGILEFGVLRESYSEEPKSYVETNFITDYYQFDDQMKTHKIGSYFENFYYSYKIQLPEQYEQIEIHLSDDYTYLSFLDPLTKDLLFDVYVTKIEQNFTDRWELIEEINGTYYLTSVNNTKQLFTFSLLEQ